MTDPQPRPDAYTEPTMPLLPTSGYGPQQPAPFTEDTLAEPLPYRWPETNYQQPQVGYSVAQSDPAPTAPAPAASNYRQPEVGYQPYPATPASDPAPAWADPAPAPAPAPAYGTQASGVPATPWQAAAPTPYYGFSGPVPDHPNSTIALVLGILGIVGFWPLAPFAWYLGAKGKREMREFPGRWGNSGGLTAGVVLGAIVTILGALLALLFLFVMLIAWRSFR